VRFDERKQTGFVRAWVTDRPYRKVRPRTSPENLVWRQGGVERKTVSPKGFTSLRLDDFVAAEAHELNRSQRGTVAGSKREGKRFGR
jgi:hypothetical protein